MEVLLMTYTYNLSDDVGKIRLIIGDKDITNPVFSDEELQYFMDSEGSVNLAAAGALEAWAASYAANADNERIGDYSYMQTITDKMLKLAAKLRKDDSEKPSITWAEPDFMGTGG
jgi:hypothetical protein